MPDLGYTLIEYALKVVGLKKNVPSTYGRKADILCECKERVVVIASADAGAEALVSRFASAVGELTLRPSRQSGGLGERTDKIFVWPVLVAAPALRDIVCLFRVKKQTGAQPR